MPRHVCLGACAHAGPNLKMVSLWASAQKGEPISLYPRQVLLWSLQHVKGRQGRPGKEKAGLGSQLFLQVLLLLLQDEMKNSQTH